MFWKKYIEFQFVRNKISLSFVWIACLSPHTLPFTSLLRKSEIRERFHWIWDGTTLHTRWHSDNLEALTLAAPWWEGCAAPSPGWPPSAPPLEQPAPAEPSQPPRCQPGRDQAQSGNCGIGFKCTIYYWVYLYTTEQGLYLHLQIAGMCKSFSSEFAWFAFAIHLNRAANNHPSLPSVFPRAQQSASASRPAPSRGLQSCPWRPPAAASGCSPRGASPVDPETVSGRDLLLACSPRAGPSGCRCAG